MSGDVDGAIPYQAKVFKDFIALIARLFYDDGSIILLDLLSREQRAMSEIQLRDRLRWRENLLHQKLYNLEKQLILEKVVESERGNKVVYLWRIHSKIFLSIEWRLNSMTQTLQDQLKFASKQNDLKCNVCQRSVTPLEAASGPKALENEHPLCKLCGTPLSTSDSEAARTLAENRLKRAQIQLSSLREALRRVKGMDVPQFQSTPYLSTESNASSEITESAPPPPPPPPETFKKESKPAASAQQPAAPAVDARAIPWFQQQAAASVTTGSVSSVTRVSNVSFGTGSSVPALPKAPPSITPSFGTVRAKPLDPVAAPPSEGAPASSNRPPTEKVSIKPFSLSLSDAATDKSSLAGTPLKRPVAGLGSLAKRLKF